MTEQIPITDEIFPKDGRKSYALVEIMPGETEMVDKGPDNTVFSFPVVLLWEIVLTLVVTLGLFLFSLVKQAPLDEIANLMVTTDPAKAPWYFMGLQELLEHMHPTLAGIVVPTILVLFLIALPYLDRLPARPGVWFSSARGKRITGWTAVYTLLVMPGYIFLDNMFPLRELLRASLPAWMAQGLLPGLIVMILVLLPLLVVWRKKGTRHELIMTLFTVMIVSAFVFTLSGFLFRGPGFKLYWPWQMPDGYNPWAEL